MVLEAGMPSPAQAVLNCRNPPPDFWEKKSVIHALRVRSNPAGSHPASSVESSEYEKALDLVREGELLNGARGGNRTRTRLTRTRSLV